MTEKQKMLAGLLYFSEEDELLKERQEAKQLCFELNNLPPQETKTKEEILKKLLKHKGQGVTVELPFRCDYGYNISIGDDTFINYNCTVLDCCEVTIGKNVLIGPNCGIYAATHPTDKKLRLDKLEFAKPITVCDNVWIGGSVVILAGVTIGQNSVIGAGSVVTKDIPPDSIAVGNPCKVIKKI